MGFKKKVFGFLAAVALTLSTGAGIASAQSNAEFELTDAACSSSMITSEFDFGTWVWTGTQWVIADGSSRTSNLQFSIVAPWQDDCNVSLSVSEFTSGEYSVSGTNFSWRMAGGNVWFNFLGLSPSSPGTALIKDVDSGNHTLQVRLNRPNADTAGPGEYEGTVTLGLSSGQ